MIYTVTPNPALDITWGVPGWKRGSTTRVTDIRESPGGKGLNVARVADQLGASARAVGPLGGATGERVRDLFTSLAPSVRTRWIDSPVPTRRSVALVDEQVSIFNEGGYAPPREVWSRSAEFLASVLTLGDVCAICGSLPGDSRASDIAPIFEAAKASGARIILDTSGAALIDAASQADVLKPNEHEQPSTKERACSWVVGPPGCSSPEALTAWTCTRTADRGTPRATRPSPETRRGQATLRWQQSRRTSKRACS